MEDRNSESNILLHLRVHVVLSLHCVYIVDKRKVLLKLQPWSSDVGAEYYNHSVKIDFGCQTNSKQFVDFGIYS